MTAASRDPGGREPGDSVRHQIHIAAELPELGRVRPYAPDAVPVPVVGVTVHVAHLEGCEDLHVPDGGVVFSAPDGIRRVLIEAVAGDHLHTFAADPSGHAARDAVETAVAFMNGCGDRAVRVAGGTNTA